MKSSIASNKNDNEKGTTVKKYITLVIFIAGLAISGLTFGVKVGTIQQDVLKDLQEIKQETDKKISCVETTLERKLDRTVFEMYLTNKSLLREKDLEYQKATNDRIFKKLDDINDALIEMIKTTNSIKKAYKDK